MTVDLAAVLDYLSTGVSETGGNRWDIVAWEDPDTPGSYPQIQDALDAETASQAMKVTYPVDENGDPVPAPDLDEALKRRVARNLAMRALPLSVEIQNDFGPVRPSTSDPEIRRLEAAYRRRVVG